MPTPVHVLHVIQQLSRGGASRALVAAAVSATATGWSRHRIVSLCPPEPGGLKLAGDAGVPVADRTASAHDLAREADIVQIHFWNTPSFSSSAGRAARLRVCCSGRTSRETHLRTCCRAPSSTGRIPPRLVAALPLLSGKRARLTGFFAPSECVSPRSRRFRRRLHRHRRSHKMHHAFVPMHVRVAAQVPDLHVTVCGSGRGFDDCADRPFRWAHRNASNGEATSRTFGPSSRRWTCSGIR